uniref:Uncharacterized protein n=1 Tax=Rhizophora mucronata TaxID=61149 RepID=A0A2P2PJ24_RHIMU
MLEMQRSLGRQGDKLTTASSMGGEWIQTGPNNIFYHCCYQPGL